MRALGFALELVLVLIFGTLMGVASARAALADGSHIAQSAETLKQLQWSFKPFPGSNPVGKYSSFLLNSLSIGVTDNFEIGFIPLAWSNSENSSMKNFNFRYVFYRNSYWTSSSGVQQSTMATNFKTENYNYQSDTNITSLFFANSFVLNPDWRITHNIAFRSTSTKTNATYIGKGQDPVLLNFPQVPEIYTDHYLDLSYTKSITNVWAFGISRATDSVLGISIETAATWGAGVSHTWNLRRSWMSQISIGAHYLDNGLSKFLLGMAF